MPERRLSRLLKAKLLRRSSTPAVPKAGNGADPRVHPNSTSRNSNPRTPQPLDSASEKSPYSVVSSPAEPSFDEPSPGSAPDRQGRALKPRHPDEPRPSSPSIQLYHQRKNRTDTPPPTESNLSSLHTPLTEEVPSPSSTPLRTPQHSDDNSFRSANAKIRAATPSDPPLTPALETVVERALEISQSPSSPSFPPSAGKRPSLAVRRQSLLPASHQDLISGLLDPNQFFPGDYYPVRAPEPANEMVQRRVWVKRPGGSATLVPCMEDAVVDELRDQVIMKYVNSLGRSFDSPDIVIRIHAREGSNRQAHAERLLSPEEVLFSVLDSYYPGGQSIDEALVIDAPSRRTPKPSPRHTVYHHHQPGENGDYFPLMPAQPNPTPPGHPSASVQSNAPSISILTTGVVPPLPSPGGRGSRHHRRPPLTRHATNSPTILGQGVTVTEAGISPHTQIPPPAPTQNVPTPPAPLPDSPQSKIHTPPVPPVASPRTLRKSKGAASPGAVFGGLIDGTVPPINVLIVEDNIINQKLLEAFMKRLSVRWKCAANGEEAVRKWRQGGFHLVLMDIQLPVMNGLDATKEIRRLERLNGIGVFPKNASGRSSASSAATTPMEDRRPSLHRSVSEEDTLSDLSLFRSPVIIVALTASSLQSDRHEALAAGCNDFLTKPVGFPWLEQKVTEWGCMQALIDFEGWRKWRGFMDSPRSSSPAFDNAASPMQGGSRHQSVSHTQLASPLVTRTNAKLPRHKLQRPHLPDAGEILREDSWGSGSGADTADTGDTADSISPPVASQPPTAPEVAVESYEEAAPSEQ